MKGKTMSDVDNQGPTDDELLNDVLSDGETTDETVVAETVEQVEENPEEATEQATTEETAEKPPIPPKPEWRLREDAERARAAETELARERADAAALRQRLEALERGQQKPVQQKEEDDGPDPLLDPKGYAKHVREEIRNELLNERREDSMKSAHDADPAVFKAAYDASLQAMQSGDVSIKARMQNARDPGKELLKWHKEQKDRAEIGSDLGAYKQRMRDELLKDPEFRKQATETWQSQTQTPDGRPRTSLPPSLNGASRANTTLKAAQDDVPDDELFRQIAG